MGSEYSHIVNKSSVHETAMEIGCESRPNRVMARSLAEIAKRLELTQEALDLPAAELCRQTDISPNAWSQFTNPESKRRITLNEAYKLRDAFGVTLDWIYDGDPSGLPQRLYKKLRIHKAA
jgi:transcriptional regulator with XRE-family HTH domain